MTLVTCSLVVSDIHIRKIVQWFTSSREYNNGLNQTGRLYNMVPIEHVMRIQVIYVIVKMDINSHSVGSNQG